MNETGTNKRFRSQNFPSRTIDQLRSTPHAEHHSPSAFICVHLQLKTSPLSGERLKANQSDQRKSQTSKT